MGHCEDVMQALPQNHSDSPGQFQTGLSGEKSSIELSSGIW